MGGTIFVLMFLWSSEARCRQVQTGFALCAAEASVTLAVAGEKVVAARTAPVGPVASTIVSGAKSIATHGAAAV